MIKPEMFHCWIASSRHVASIPVTFYVSEEVFEDDASVTDEMLADLLKPWLTLAIHEHRKTAREKAA